MHRGKYIHNKMKDLGFSIDRMMIEISVGRTTLWRWLNDENLPLFKMKRIADILKVDLRNDFPDANQYYQSTELKNEISKDYQLLYLKELEKVRELQEELEEYKKSKPFTGTESGQ